MTVIALLGPQRLRPTVGAVLRRLGIDGPVATITAGWEEREREDDELADHLGGGAVNLELFARYETLLHSDAALHEADRRRRAALDGLRRLYRLRLDHAVRAGWALLRRDDDPELLAPEQAAAIEAIRTMDAHHLERVRAIDTAFAAACRPADHPALRAHLDEVAARLEDCAALAIAGGHVGVLLHLLRLFALPGAGPGDLFGPVWDRPILAWSAGAMVLADRVVLFHDSPPQGAGSAEVHGPGLGLVPGVLPLPHARRRLRLDDATRVGLLARRFRPLDCLAMDEGELLVREGITWTVEEGVRRLTDDGQVRAPVAEASAP